MSTVHHHYNLCDIYLENIKVGSAQSCSLDHSFTLKSMPGPERFAKKSAYSDESLKLKLGTTEWRGALMATLLGASVVSGGRKRVVETVALTDHEGTVAQAATYLNTLVVLDSSGNELKPVASSPAAGQYSVAAGVYTAGGSITSIVVHYEHSTTDGFTATVVNATATTAPTFKVKLYDAEDDQVGHELYAVAFTNLSLGFKLKDFGENNIEGECQADASGNVWGFWYR